MIPNRSQSTWPRREQLYMWQQRNRLVVIGGGDALTFFWFIKHLTVCVQFKWPQLVFWCRLKHWWVNIFPPLKWNKLVWWDLSGVSWPDKVQRFEPPTVAIATSYHNTSLTVTVESAARQEVMHYSTSQSTVKVIVQLKPPLADTHTNTQSGVRASDHCVTPGCLWWQGKTEVRGQELAVPVIALIEAPGDDNTIEY